eukprot:1748523-Rhodomonas_salina.1
MADTDPHAAAATELRIATGSAQRYTLGVAARETLCALTRSTALVHTQATPGHTCVSTIRPPGPPAHKQRGINCGPAALPVQTVPRQPLIALDPSAFVCGGAAPVFGGAASVYGSAHLVTACMACARYPTFFVVMPCAPAPPRKT